MEEQVGHVTHWWGHIGVAGVHMDSGTLHVGDQIHIVGKSTDVYETLDSMEVDHHKVPEAGVGADVGVWLGQHVREHDRVYRVIEDAARHP